MCVLRVLSPEIFNILVNHRQKYGIFWLFSVKTNSFKKLKCYSDNVKIEHIFSPTNNANNASKLSMKRTVIMFLGGGGFVLTRVVFS